MSEQEVDVHNARQLIEDIVARLEVIEHERWQIEGALDDLALYLPAPALNPEHRNDGFIRP